MLGRVIGFALVVVFVGLLASPFLQQNSGPGVTPTGSPAAAGSTASPETPTDAPPGARVVPISDTFVGDGLSVAFAAKPAVDPAGLTEVSFRLVDAAGRPVVPSAPPAVWIGRQALAASPAGDAPTCEDRIKSYIQGTFDARPEIDLTSYFVLALNDDATISVIDPLNGVAGISQLFAMVLLAGRGEDWVMGNDGKTLFVSMPEIGQVAVVNTDDFEVARNIDVGGTPVRMTLQPDGRSLWVADDPADGAPGGVTVVDTATFEVIARLDAAPGEHEVVFSGEVADAHGHDSEATPGPDATTTPGSDATTTYAFVANRGAGTLAIVDAKRLEMDGTLDVGAPIVALDYASASNAVYVAGEGRDELVVIDATRHEIVGRIETSPGVQALRFAPGGRWGFAVSPANDSVDVIDATTNRVVHTLHIPGAPDRISFSASHAYVHASQRPDVSLIDLARASSPETLQAIKVIGGEMAPAQSPVQLSVADPIVPIREHGDHVLIANPGDKSIYYYMEGMNAPMGAFVNYGRAPRAVGVVDRSIRETAPGAYGARVRVPGSGEYQVAFLLDSPRVVHCFTFTAEPDPAAGAGEEGVALRIMSTEREVTAGQPLAVRVAIVDPRTNEPVAGIADLQVLATLASGQRSDRFEAVAVAPGTYEAELRFASPGIYNVYFAIPSRGAGAGDLPSVTLRVLPAQPE